jgi:hypothetical protein
VQRRAGLHPRDDEPAPIETLDVEARVGEAGLRKPVAERGGGDAEAEAEGRRGERDEQDEDRSEPDGNSPHREQRACRATTWEVS